jgi:UPF0755 protein
VNNRRRPPKPTRSRPPARRRSTLERRLLWLLAGAAAVVIGALSTLWIWAVLPGPGNGRRIELELPAASTASEAGDLLAAHGLVASPGWFAVYVRLVRPSLDFQPGPHLLNDAASPRELVRRLARLPTRPVARVTIPEGYSLFQVAERLEQLEVCSRAAFIAAAHDPSLRHELGIRGESVEGFLFPATYELSVDSAPAQVIRAMVRTLRRRLERLDAKHDGAASRLRSQRGWHEHELLTLASIVEREARHPDEAPTIASVYFNRLDDPDFRPRRMLMADPTAGYGCLVAPKRAPSCAGYHGRITPAMLRDAANPYNTYKHPGLPPGPIANPGQNALEAVLAPAKTPFLFFVANGRGRHRFSRTLEEHNRAIEEGDPRRR